MFKIERVGRLDQHGLGRQSIYVVRKKYKGSDEWFRVCVLHLGVGYCCAMNMIQNLNLVAFKSADDVEQFVKALSAYDFAMGVYPDANHGFRCKDFFYATHSGYWETKEGGFSFLFNHPAISLAHQWPSASEPGHDVVLLKLHVS